ncbi:hypothetical protein BKA66DRAFT_475785 [Pyrenochaeta sp. MPI-SDFR-AT-0127]|nr:hypothetical protein BKA66DRAFT_475785 [Pyrenochaeta sp. MPI-SDFR-AT-0127]
MWSLDLLSSKASLCSTCPALWEPSSHLEHVLFDTRDPVFRFGEGLSYDTVETGISRNFIEK